MYKKSSRYRWLVQSRTNFLSEIRLLLPEKMCTEINKHVILNQYTYFIHPIHISIPNINVC